MRQTTTLANDTISASASLIVGSGEIARLIRNHPWHDSPLGPIETWPSTLLATVNLILNSPAALAIYWGPEMIFLGNDASFRMIGPRPTSVLGQTAPDLWGANWHQMSDRFEGVLSVGRSFHGKSIPFTFPREGKSDEVFIDFSLSPIYHEGKIAGVFRSLLETTESVIARRTLVESNERLHLALSVGNGFGVWDYHIQTGIVYADEIMAKLYGIDPKLAEAGTSHLLYQRMLHPDDIVVLTDAIMESIMTGNQYTVEYRVRRADGSYRRIKSVGRCVFDEQGHPYRITGLKTEITTHASAPMLPS